MQRFAQLRRSRSSKSDVGPRTSFFPASMVLFCYICVSFCGAQVSANLSGVVTDSSGAAVSGATVTAKSVDTGISRTSTTGSSGRYRFFALPVGVYEVRVTKDGFAEAVRSGIGLAVGQDATTACPHVKQKRLLRPPAVLPVTTKGRFGVGSTSSAVCSTAAGIKTLRP